MLRYSCEAVKAGRDQGAQAEPENAACEVLAIAARSIPYQFGLDPARDVQVLCPNRWGR